MRNFPSWQLTTTANLRPYHYEPTTLLLRTYHLTTTSPRSTKGRVKEHLWVRPRWVYGWDTNTCMGEIPQQLWARRRGAAELISTNPQPSPCVMWNKTGWKSVIIKVDSWQQRRLWIMWIGNIANFTLKLMSGQLIAELTLSLSTNYHFSTIFLCLMTGKN